MEEVQARRLTLTNVRDLKGYSVNISTIEDKDKDKHILRIDIPFADSDSPKEVGEELVKANTGC